MAFLITSRNVRKIRFNCYMDVVHFEDRLVKYAISYNISGF